MHPEWGNALTVRRFSKGVPPFSTCSNCQISGTKQLGHLSLALSAQLSFLDHPSDNWGTAHVETKGVLNLPSPMWRTLLTKLLFQRRVTASHGIRNDLNGDSYNQPTTRKLLTTRVMLRHNSQQKGAERKTPFNMRPEHAISTQQNNTFYGVRKVQEGLCFCDKTNSKCPYLPHNEF